MIIRVQLTDLLDGNFRFYLNEPYRKMIFAKLYSKHAGWKNVSRNLKIDQRTLFGIRRGYEVPHGSESNRYLSPTHLKSIIEDMHSDIAEIERNIIQIKSGHGGLRSKATLPLELDVEKEPLSTTNRALAEYLLSKQYVAEQFSSGLPENFVKSEGYMTLNIKIPDNRIRSLHLQGLKPLLKLEENSYAVTYRAPGTNKYITKSIPKQVIFDEQFAKEFGKWVGDRCGGPHKVGVANKQFSFIDRFSNLLKLINQPDGDIKIAVTCNPSFKPNEEILSKVSNMYCCKTQYGDYAYKVEVANKILRNLVFDVFEKYLFEVLFSSSDLVKYAFYAGLVEAEGSIDLRSKEILISFGFNLGRDHLNSEVLNLLKRVSMHIKVLKSLGFDPQISRKASKSTLKYDIRFKRNDALRFIQNTASFINHEPKLERMNLIRGEK